MCTRPGFSLLELVLALAIAGLILLTARLIVESTAHGAAAIREAASDADRLANADLLLRALVGRTETGGAGAPAVAGDRSRVRLATWCDVPAGWQERCHVTVAVVAAGSESAVVARFDDGREVLLIRGFHTGAVLYLDDVRWGGAWQESWDRQLATPPALGLVLDGDTVILRIGERG